MQQWQCNFCAFIYDEEQGWPEEGVPPGAKFEDIPDDWCFASRPSSDLGDRVVRYSTVSIELVLISGSKVTPRSVDLTYALWRRRSPSRVSAT